MLRRCLVASILLAAALTAARGQMVDTSDMPRAKPPANLLQGGVQQDQNASPDNALIDPTTDSNWELQARSRAAEQEEAQAGAFMGSPLVFRVTSVGDTDKSAGTQKITAMPIKSTTISSDGTVNLGQLIDGSGDTMYIPPGTLQKGDLFTRIANQYVKVPANHFDPMRTLADQVNKQLPMNSPTALNNLGNQLANAADAYKNNAATFANDFLLVAGNVMGNTIQFLAQPRGDFGQPGKPMQDLLNYLNNDNAANNAQLGEAAQQAMQTLATHPGTVAGNLFMAMLPAGQLGKDAEIAQVTQATQRLTAVENAANDFANLERGLPPSSLAPEQYPTVPGNAALAHANYPPGGPGIPEPYLPGEPTINRPVPPRAPVPGGGDAVRTPGGGDTVRTPGGAGGTVPSRATGGDSGAPPRSAETPGLSSNPNSPLQSRNIPPASNAPPRSAETPGLSSNPNSPLQSRNIPPASNAPPRSAETSGLSSNPNSPLQSRNIPPASNAPPRSAETPAAQAARDAQSRQIAAQRSADAARQEVLRQPPRSAARPANPAPITPQQRQALQESVQKLQSALDRDAQWANTQPVQSPPAASPSARGDIINTLQSKFGNNSKDPLQGAPSLLESRFGIPTPATAASINTALQTAGKNAQGLVFSQNPDHTLNILNARNNDGQIEFLDPATERRASPPADSPLYFYRTH